MNRPVRKYILLAAKLLVAAALLVWVFSQVHWHDYVIDDETGVSYPVLDRLEDQPAQLDVGASRPWRGPLGVRPVEQFQPLPGGEQVIRSGLATSLLGMHKGLLLAAVVCFLLQLLIVAVRWWFLLRLQRIRIALWEVVRLTFLGLFFNSVVPGTVGGDLVKAWYVARHTPKKAAVLVSIFVDRVLGLTELTLMAAAMVALVYFGWVGQYDAARLREPIIAVTVVSLVVVATMAFLLSRRFRRFFHLQKVYQRLPVAHHIAAAGEAAMLYRRRLGSLVRAIFITFGAHVFFVGAIALLGLSLRLATPWYNYFIYVPLIYILGAVPLTPGGAGLVESLYVAFFASAATGRSEVVALALLARLIPILWGLPGVVVAVTGPKLPKVAQLQAEMEIATVEEAVTDTSET